MKLFRFDQSVGRSIDKFGSKNLVITPILRILERHIDVVQISSMNMNPGGLIGGHEAHGPQLFIVVAGEGFITGRENLRIPIQSGQMAFWETGEWHEVMTIKGMSAIVIESDQLSPEELLLEEIIE
ncbi:cupin domain-containing protein [Paenibacillus sp. DXFW5]|uniref:Cupin domain-containing protein n=1 Tax=Paenibacillus rhizolycopersici TaxID=2780073 RepID=A0ABS2H5A4_9BACL|nr:cupin domain-containing protein [Paenibacillus rhizolycopersici]MBM6995988.1 cupin domain-containing protein [Paenibacillus rhizolycopersici]